MNLQEHCRLYDDERLATLAFSHRVRPPRTKWPPPLPRQVPPPGLALPRSIHDILLPWAYGLRKRWYSEMAADMRRMISDPENYVRRCIHTIG